MIFFLFRRGASFKILSCNVTPNTSKEGMQQSSELLQSESGFVKDETGEN